MCDGLHSQLCTPLRNRVSRPASCSAWRSSGPASRHTEPLRSVSLGGKGLPCIYLPFNERRKKRSGPLSSRLLVVPPGKGSRVSLYKLDYAERRSSRLRRYIRSSEIDEDLYRNECHPSWQENFLFSASSRALSPHLRLSSLTHTQPCRQLRCSKHSACMSGLCEMRREQHQPSEERCSSHESLLWRTLSPKVEGSRVRSPS